MTERLHRSRSRSLVLASIAILASAGGASAELFRCQQPDGRVVFTDSAAKCPGAKPHEPRAAIQNVVKPPPVSRPAHTTARPVVRRSDSDAMLAAQWREKKTRAQDELGALDDQYERLNPFLKICNRGGTLYSEKANGMRRRVSCQQLRDEVTRLDERKATLRAYLDYELEQECRRAGCLPGWLR